MPIFEFTVANAVRYVTLTGDDPGRFDFVATGTGSGEQSGSATSVSGDFTTDVAGFNATSPNGCWTGGGEGGGIPMAEMNRIIVSTDIHPQALECAIPSRATPLKTLLILGWGGELALVTFDSSGAFVAGSATAGFGSPQNVTRGKREDPPVFEKLLYGNAGGTAANNATLTTNEGLTKSYPNLADSNDGWVVPASTASINMDVDGCTALEGLIVNGIGGLIQSRELVLLTKNGRVASVGYGSEVDALGFRAGTLGQMDPNFS